MDSTTNLRLAALAVALAVPATALDAEQEARAMVEPARLHLLFWQGSDVRDAEGVSFRAHPFPQDGFEVLIEADSDRPTLWYMPTDAVPGEDGIRIYYQRVEKGLPEPLDQRVWCLGVLTENGFMRPDLGLFEQPWPGPRNIALQRSPYTPTWGGFNVFQTIRTAAGLTVLCWDQPGSGLAGAMLATSPDGIHWTKEQRGTVFTEHNDAHSLIANPYGEGYLLYQTQLVDWPDKPHPDNIPGRRRVISLRRSPDLVSWSPQGVILEPDVQDGPTAEFYLLNTMWYVDRQLGMLMKYYANPEMPNRHSNLTRNELLFSQDGTHWKRPYRDSELGLWTYADLFEHGGSLCAVAHHERDLVLARTRQDGLASVGTDTRGSLRTSPFRLPPGELLLNAECAAGSIRVQLIADTGVALPLRWTRPLPEGAIGGGVHLRFLLDNARVYALREGDGK